MQTKLEPTLAVVAQAKTQIEGSTARLLHLLSFVPDEKLDWSPSATSKSVVRLVTHIARSDSFFANVIAGIVPEVMPTPEEFLADLHVADPSITTQKSAVAVLQESMAALVVALDGVTSKTLEAPRVSPVGTHRTWFWIGFATEHRTVHTGQLEYLQTIWGDLDNHFS
ncbi:DinB family protein [bacterium]|nr:MAG: DinB family protein [bacterium]